MLAVLGQLRATRNWYRSGANGVADPPATELGEREWAFSSSPGGTPRSQLRGGET